MIYAAYRLFYGEDFVQESIKSIRDHVDKIFVFWDDRIWGDAKSVIYKGQEVKFPEKFDNTLEKVKELNDPKVTLVYDHVSTDKGQFTHIVNDVLLKNWVKPNLLMMIEVDHVFKKSEIVKALEIMSEGKVIHATTRPIELWKTYEYRIPERNRVTTVFWDMDKIDSLPATGRFANVRHTPQLPVYTHNFGFCWNPQTVYWKHLLALANAPKTGDRAPNEAWYDKWLNWTIDGENKDLEISKGNEHNIPYAYKYDINELPEVIKEKYKL